ncbi:Uu.00g113490.m01.CDS01 [Anthostomella pinea]|uniref:Uu.00g113490.m01.CDS01 n=1 Tax=Anthostomella pinea TaxID=933095 RepID=A0AAI8VGF1_9PEZI|nr:Uu.00g113490.m01.CDS01 [Anthostomella pinea]
MKYRAEMGKHVWKCEGTVKIGHDFTGACFGESSTKTAARVAAWLQLLSQMHEAGLPKTLFSNPADKRPKKDPKPSAQLPSEPADSVPTGAVSLPPSNQQHKQSPSAHSPEVSPAVTPEVTPVKADIGASSRQLMRRAVAEARAAGLPSGKVELEVEAAPRSRRSFRTRLSTAAEAELNSKLREQQQILATAPEHAPFRAKQATLPINIYRSQVMEMILKNQVSCVVGATGSGKTTQVAQMILDHFISMGSGASCNVVCTQPRRIAASSVARRVAVERNEDLGDSVGYHVRLDAATSPSW